MHYRISSNSPPPPPSNKRPPKISDFKINAPPRINAPSQKSEKITVYSSLTQDQIKIKGQKRKSYSMEFKQEAITFAEENGNNSAARRLYSYHWMAEGVHQYTEAGNMKPPPRKKIVQSILESWAALSKEMIVESFKSCSLNLANDGSEYERIHCFKPKEPCHAGRQQLKWQLSVLDERNRDNPFENITDSDVEDAIDDLNIVDASDDENDIDIEI